jgi:IS5 family transposase
MLTRWLLPPFSKAIGATVLRTKVDPQPTLWESLLGDEFRRLPPGLLAVDAFLDDPVFFEPFVPYFDPLYGRPSIPIETYLRLMHLRFRYRLGFETLCAEVTDSLSWRRFCRIGPYDKVPDASTLMKITKRCGEEVIAQLNEALLKKADSAHLVKLDKVRADTTVVPANVAYPTDSGLLAKGVAKLARSVSSLKSMRFACRTRFRDRTRSVRRRAHSIGAWLRRRNDEAKTEVLAITGELADIAEASIAEALAVARNARRSLARAGKSASRRAGGLVAEIEQTAKVLEQIVAQTRTRLCGEVPDGSKRIVSLHDTDARPIAKGRLGKPVEFGYKAQITDNSDGIVVDLTVHQGNPTDAPLLVPAIKRVKALLGRAPKAVTADRGYGEASVESGLARLGVEKIAIPRKGRPGSARRSVESSRGFRTLIKWRTGSEGRISHLKHSWGLDRTLLDGVGGATTWCGWGVLAHNTAKIAALAEGRKDKPAPVHQERPPSKPADTGPPTGRSPTPHCTP